MKAVGDRGAQGGGAGILETVIAAGDDAGFASGRAAWRARRRHPYNTGCIGGGRHDPQSRHARARVGAGPPSTASTRSGRRCATRRRASCATSRRWRGLAYACVLNHDRLEAAVAHRIADRLDGPGLDRGVIARSFADMAEEDADFALALRARPGGPVYDRDPACSRFIEPVLYFKGFHALQTHRLAHWLHEGGHRDLALYLQSRASGGVPGGHQPGGAGGPRHLHRPRHRRGESARRR